MTSFSPARPTQAPGSAYVAGVDVPPTAEPKLAVVKRSRRGPESREGGCASVRNQADGEKAPPLPALVFSVKAVASLKSRVTRCRVVTVPSASLTWTMPSTGMEAGACWSLRYSRQLLLTGQHGVLGPAVAATAGARSMQVHHQPRRQRGHVGTRCGSITARIRRRVLKTDVDRRERNAPLTALRQATRSF
jgi:hypothetical protein